jgi:hypothetical protein
MTAAELIEKLREFPGDAEMVFESGEYSYEVEEASLFTWPNGETQIELRP